VSYSKLCSLESGGDKCKRITGWLAAIITGAALPSFVFLMGDLVDSFDPTEGPASTLDSVKRLAAILSGIGLAIWITSHIYYTMLLIYSTTVTRKIRVEYLKKILAQEIAWFDETNPSELGARINKECMAIQKALGEKMGTILLAFAMTVSGVTMAFTRGWTFSFVLLALFPLIFSTTILMTKVMQTGFVENMIAYS